MTEDQELDAILDEVDRMCWECDEGESEEVLNILTRTLGPKPEYAGKTVGQWSRIDDRLREVDVLTTPMVLLIGWLMSTNPVKGKLTYRKAFCNKIRERLEAENDPETDQLLAGLE